VKGELMESLEKATVELNGASGKNETGGGRSQTRL
jgi:hypothetical protein